MSGLPVPGVAAGFVSTCVSSLGTGLCFLPSFVYQVLFTVPFTGEPVDLFVLCPVPCPTGQCLGVGGWGRACTVNQVFTFTLNEFLGTNHVFHLCTFCISIKMEMETAHLAVEEVGMEVQNWVGGMWLWKSRQGLRSP